MFQKIIEVNFGLFENGGQRGPQNRLVGRNSDLDDFTIGCSFLKSDVASLLPNH